MIFFLISTGQVLKFVQAQIYFFAVSFVIFLSVFHFLCQKEGKLHYRTVKCEGHEKRDGILVSKAVFIFRISQREESFIY